ncbi:Type IV secretion system protein, VipA-like [Desulfonema limicola]|uniref:Type IV secretion system protein, VipA-like n=1 Tax=Desulfonema limicola TaxID=45656 RepID=A0A975B981_9BACT|nr:type VI secretion system contractile sheath small subunit [Desulfonema limicola]QTA81198.1 Type IV secretion system protein, VipA-like [Desulfonema limicola]
MAIQDEIPKSRLTLRYKTEVNGQPEDVSLPLRLLVANDFSLGSSKDRKVDLDERRIRSMNGKNTDSVMKDMGIKVNFAVPNKIDPDKAEDMQVDIPIDSIRAFSPDQVAKHVPKVKSLLMLKELMEEVISNVDNRKDFRKLLGELMSNEEALAKMMEELKGYESLKLPSAG